MKVKDEKEWFFQAEYDIESAALMYRGGRYIYAIFLTHLSIEKALKAVYFLKFKKDPPKIHDLSDLTAITNLKLPDDLHNFIDKFSALSVSARYPEDLKWTLMGYDKAKTKTAMDNCRKVLKCVKSELNPAS